jgi:hypothetical protein
MDLTKKGIDVPTGLNHFAMIRKCGQHALETSEPMLKEMEPQLEFLGWALAALYEVGTCNRKCWGGPHLLESLSARVYNLGVSAYLLTVRGFYDEALNLVRSIGEIGNLISLVATEEHVVDAWVAADKATRIRKFSPAAVRRRLEKGRGVLIAPQDWYGEFCDRYTHPTPGVTPNMHNTQGLGYVGGIVQKDGLRKSVDEVVEKVGAVALMAAAFAQLHEYVTKLSTLVDNLESEDT